MPTNCLEHYERAVDGLMKDSQLLYFAYADFEEERRSYDKVKKIYERLLEREHVDPTLVSPSQIVSFVITLVIVLHSTDELYATCGRR